MSFPKLKTTYPTEIRTFRSQNGDRSYLVYRTHGKSGTRAYHVYIEVEAKEAAMDCGSKLRPSIKYNTTMHWDRLWSKPRP